MKHPHVFLIACALLLMDSMNAAGGTLFKNASVVSGGISRYWDYYVPPGLPSHPPVVVVLHGGGQNKDLLLDPARVSPAREWLQIADEDGVLVLVPNGVDVSTGLGQGTSLTWNDCRGDNSVTSSMNDIAFLNAMLDWADSSFSVDPQRIYVTGASNGGLMSYRVAQELSHRVAAVAAFIANKPAVDECGNPQFPISVFICDGTGEALYMPWAGGVVAGNPNSGTVISAPATRDYWVAFNTCVTSPQLTNYPDLDPTEGSTATRLLHPGGADGAEVELIVVFNGGHVVPSIEHQYNDASLLAQRLGIQNQDIEGAREAWAFLSRQVRGQGLAGVDPARESTGGRLVLEPARPNPSSATATLSFTLPQAGPARLVLADVAGRRVRTLLDATLAAGSHSVSWDGYDERGAIAAAGLYWVRIESSGETVVTRLVRMR